MELTSASIELARKDHRLSVSSSTWGDAAVCKRVVFAFHERRDQEIPGNEFMFRNTEIGWLEYQPKILLCDASKFPMDGRSSPLANLSITLSHHVKGL